jgi:hypothetical protein
LLIIIVLSDPSHLDAIRLFGVVFVEVKFSLASRKEMYYHISKNIMGEQAEWQKIVIFYTIGVQTAEILFKF